jgi:hypothetical protein
MRCRDSPFSLRLDHRRACSHRIDRTLATDPRASRPPVPQPTALAQTSEAIAARIALRANSQSTPPHRPRILSTAASVQPINHRPELPA